MKYVSAVINMPIDRLMHHPDNPRKDLGDLSELQKSIEENGIMQNLTVVPIVAADDEDWLDTLTHTKDPEELEQIVEGSPEENFYVLIGNRRFEAAEAAGVAKVPVRIVAGLTKAEQIGVMLEENIQRNDLTIPEQAYGFQRLIDLGESVDTIVDKSGFSRATVYHRLNIAKLDKKLVEDAIEGHQLTINDFSKLERIQDINKRNEVLKRSAGNLAYEIERAIKEENNEKWKRDTLSALRESFVVSEFPKDAHSWEDGWEYKCALEYGEEADLSVFDQSDILYMNTWNGLSFYQYDEEAKNAAEFRKLETARAQEELKQSKKELEDLWDHLKSQITIYFNFLIREEENEAPNPDTVFGDCEEMWYYLLDNGCVMDLDDLYDARVFKDELADADPSIINELSMRLQMGLFVMLTMIDYQGPITWDGSFNDKAAYRIDCGLELLKRIFEFEPENEKEVSDLLNGTHPAYKD